MAILGRAFIAASVAAGVLFILGPLFAQSGAGLLEGTAAFGDWRADRPGLRRLIRPRDLPAPDFAESTSNTARIVRRTNAEKPIVPNGFEVNLFASGLSGPRQIRVAPNGDVFVAESAAGRIRVLRPNGSEAGRPSIFAADLRGPFGIAFYPPGPKPEWIYVGNTDSVVRFPYRSGDMTARAPAETVVPHLPVGGHRTRDVVFSPDGQTMYVSVGSGSNDAEDMEKRGGRDAPASQGDHALGATWGSERDRADVLAFDPQGGHGRIFATGLRIASAWRSCRRAAPCGARPTSATGLATICRRIM